MLKRSLAFFLAVFWGFSLYGKGFNVVGTDSRSVGLAGALAGETIGAEAAFYNPAGFGFLNNQQVFFTYMYSLPRLNFTPKNNNEVNLYKNSPNDSNYYQAMYRINLRNQMIDDTNEVYRVNGFSLGGEIPLGAVFSDVKGLKDLGSIGLLLYSPRFDNSIHLPLLSYETPYFLNYTYRPLALDMNIAGGINLGKFTPILNGLSIGAGVNVFLNVSANVAAFLPNVNLDLTSLMSALGGDIEALGVTLYTNGYVNEPYAITPLAGIQYKIGNNVKLGFTYRKKFFIDIKADADIHLRSLINDKDYIIPANIAMKTFYDPDQYCVGGSYKILDNLEIVAEADYNRWSQYIYPFMSAEVDPAAIKGYVTDFLGTSTGQALLSLLSGSMAQQITTAISNVNLQKFKMGLNDQDKQKLKDTLTIRVGAELRLKDKYVFDFGYYYDQNPLEENTSTKTNLLAADTHAFSFAFFYKILTSTSIGFHFQYQYLVPTEYTKDDSYRDFNGTYGEVQTKMNKISNPGYPGYTVSGGYFDVGITVSRRWGTTQ